MFTEEELTDIRKQISKRRLLILLPAVLLVGAAIALIVTRDEHQEKVISRFETEG